MPQVTTQRPSLWRMNRLLFIDASRIEIWTFLQIETRILKHIYPGTLGNRTVGQVVRAGNHAWTLPQFGWTKEPTTPAKAMVVPTHHEGLGLSCISNTYHWRGGLLESKGSIL